MKSELSVPLKARLILVLILFQVAGLADAQEVTPAPRLQDLVVTQGVRIDGVWERLPTVRVGAMRNAGEITIRVGTLTAATAKADGLHLTVVVGDLTATTFVDADEIQPLIDAIEAGLSMPIQPERKQIVREIAYETRGHFRFAAKQTGGDEPDFRFLIFLPWGLTGLPRFPEEFRADGPSGVLVPHVLRGDPNDTTTVKKALQAALQKLRGGSAA